MPEKKPFGDCCMIGRFVITLYILFCIATQFCHSVGMRWPIWETLTMNNLHVVPQPRSTLSWHSQH